MMEPKEKPVTTTKCDDRHGRLWKAVYATVGFVGVCLTVSLIAIEISYDAKAAGQKAEAAAGKLKVEVTAHEKRATEERGVVRDSLKRIEDDVKTILRNGRTHE